GMPPAPRGMPQVEVTFDIDANGILHVSAKDKATGKEQKIRIEASSGLSDTEIDKMVKAAEASAADDKQRREEIEARNQLDGLVYKVEKDSKEWVDRLSGEVKTRLDSGITAGKEALRTGESAKIRQALDELNAAYSAAGASLYQSGQAAGTGETGAAGAPGEEAKPEDVVEADYEIVDDSTKKE
ncbi:MAG: Hsp70 family protein, partial [Gemmatimonadales bacterium]